MHNRQFISPIALAILLLIVTPVIKKSFATDHEMKPAPSSNFNAKGFVAEAPNAVLNLSAKLFDGGPKLDKGVNWRLLDGQKDKGGLPKIIKHAKGGDVVFKVKPGDYILHASYGFAAVIEQLVLSKTITHTVDFNAGGIRLTATINDKVISDDNRLSFKIYRAPGDDGEPVLIVDNAKSDEIYRLTGGIYHIESQYGQLNAVTRADVQVDPGRLVEAALTHHAAAVSFRLTDDARQGSLANTTWLILGEGGDAIYQKATPFPSVILQEGKYTVIAQNLDRNFNKKFEITTGVDREILLFIDDT